MSRFSAEIVTACFTALIGLVAVIGALEFGIGWDDAGPEPGAFPFAIGILVTIGSLGTAAQTLLNGAEGTFLDRERTIRVATFFGPVLLFVPLSLVLGLYVATALYLSGVMWLQGGYRLPVAALTGIAVAVLFYVVLEIGFQVPLMKGPLEAALGLA